MSRSPRVSRVLLGLGARLPSLPRSRNQSSAQPRPTTIQIRQSTLGGHCVANTKYRCEGAEGPYRRPDGLCSDKSVRGSARSGIVGDVNRRVITSIDEFGHASQASGIAPMLLRAGALRVELMRADLGSVVADALDCSLPLAFRGQTAADRIWLVVPRNRTGSGQLNGEPLTPGNLLAFGGSAQVAGATGAPLRCGMLSIAPSALERTVTALGIRSCPPAEGELRVVPVVDGARLSRAFDLLSQAVHRQKDAALKRVQPGSLNGPSSRSRCVRWRASRRAARCINLLAEERPDRSVPARSTPGNRGTTT